MVRQEWVSIECGLEQPIELNVNRCVVARDSHGGMFLMIIAPEAFTDYLEADERKALSDLDAISGVTTEPQWKIDSLPHLRQRQRSAPEARPAETIQ